MSRNLQKSADISLVLRDVRDDVLVSTNHEQEPVIIKNTLSGKVCLSGDCGEVQRVVKVVEKDVNESLIWVIAGLVILILLIVKFLPKKVEIEEKIIYKTKTVTTPSKPILKQESILKKETKVVVETDNSEIVTIDGLMYQNQPFTKKYTWEEAKEYAKNLRLGGYDDWRLPTRDELKKLLTKKKTKGKNGEYYVRKEFMDNLESYAWFWSSTEKDSSSAWGVYFFLGGDFWNLKSFNSYALCVR